MDQEHKIHFLLYLNFKNISSWMVDKNNYLCLCCYKQTLLWSQVWDFRCDPGPGIHWIFRPQCKCVHVNTFTHRISTSRWQFCCTKLFLKLSKASLVVASPGSTLASMLTPMMVAPWLARLSSWGQSVRSLHEVRGKSRWSQNVTSFLRLKWGFQFKSYFKKQSNVRYNFPSLWSTYLRLSVNN